MVTSENRTCTSHLSKSKVTQYHSCLQEHRRFLSLWLACCHCVVLFLSVFNPMKYYDCILQSILLRLTHTRPFLFVIPSCINFTLHRFPSARRTPLISSGMGLFWQLRFCSFLKHVFMAYGILVWWWFLSTRWRYQSTVFCLPCCCEVSTLRMIPLKVMCPFPSYLLLDFSLSLIFCHFTVICVGVGLFLFIS